MSYSINQTSKEILYLPLDPVSKYKGKAFIDMFVLRAAKTLGAVILLCYTLFLKHHGVPAGVLTLAAVAALAAWVYAILGIVTRPEYQTLAPSPPPETRNLSMAEALSTMKEEALSA